MLNREFARFCKFAQIGVCYFMNVTLERILTLIPKKENGEFAHGSLKTFAESIGLKSGNLISDWIHGRSKSYQNYLYEISAKYNVSVDWLEGKTDKKEQPTVSDELSDAVSMELLNMIREASESERRDMLDLLRIVQKRREGK